MIDRNKSEIINNLCFNFCHIKKYICNGSMKCMYNKWQSGEPKVKQMSKLDEARLEIEEYKKDNDSVSSEYIFDLYEQAITELQEEINTNEIKFNQQFKNAMQEKFRENKNLKYASDQFFKITSYFQDYPEKLNLKVGNNITDKIIEFFENQKLIDRDIVEWIKDKLVYYQVFSDKKNIDIAKKLLKYFGVDE